MLLNDCSSLILSVLQKSLPSYVEYLGENVDIVSNLDVVLDKCGDLIPMANIIQIKRLLFAPLKRLHIYFEMAKVRIKSCRSFRMF
jgi:hypothetical protein